jgi:hypothetical protein
MSADSIRTPHLSSQPVLPLHQQHIPHLRPMEAQKEHSRPPLARRRIHHVSLLIAA